MADGFTPSIAHMSLTGSPPIPFTYFDQYWLSPQYQPKEYSPILDNVVKQGQDLANDALEVLMEGGATRIRMGQNPQAKIVSGLSASGIRVPETHTGSLLAISL